MAHTMLTDEDLQQSAAMSDDELHYAGGGQSQTRSQLNPRNPSASATNQSLASANGSRYGDDEDLHLEDPEQESDDMSQAEDDADADAEEDELEGDVENEEESEEEQDVRSEDDEDEGDGDFDTVDGDHANRVNGNARRVKDAPEDFSLEGDEEGEDDDEDEGVGAVKIRPGDMNDDDDEARSDGSSSQSAGEDDSDAEEAWEETAENEDDDSDNEAPSNPCVFCREDEEHDPSDEFEAYLACTSCGENAHQQCARDAGAMTLDNAAEGWRCLECVDQEDEEEALGEEAVTSPTSPRAAPRITRDLLPSQRGGMKPDSHSVFNQLVIDGDPMDGSRLLRKRKTSSADVDDSVIGLRKRRRRNSDERKMQLDDMGETDSSQPQSSRAQTQRLKSTRSKSVTTNRGQQSIMVTIQVRSDALKEILSRPPMSRRKRSNRGGSSRTARTNGARASELNAEQPLMAPFVSSAYSQPFYSFFDKETDELKGKPYGGILTEAEADTSKTLPTTEDRRRFDEAKQRAEEEWRARVLAMQAEMQVPVKKSRKSSGPASQIECIEFGGWEIDTWYAAPYPEEYSRNRVLYICEFCLKYMNSDYVAWRHKLKCPAKHPPGDEIYRHGSVSVFEVDGRKNPVYCQNLCLLAKLFLGSKTLYYDVEPFLFYVLCEYDDLGYHFVGYFSKEKRSSSQNNVSCILTLPIHQRKGYGNLLIDFSYLLTRVEQKTGSPEKPLSDMGLVSYRNYWRLIMCRYLLHHHDSHVDKIGLDGLSIRQISEDSGLTADDVISALEGLRCLARDSQTGLYGFRVDLTYCRHYVTKWESKNYVKLNPAALTWTPYVMGRSSATNFELGPAINAIAPREEDESRVMSHVAPPSSQVASSKTQLPNGHTPAEKHQEAEKENAGGQRDVMNSTELNDESKPCGKVEEEEEEEGGGGGGGGGGGRDGAPSGPDAHPSSSSQWMDAYKDIPASRFEVFPAVSGGRRNDRPRTSAVRTPVVRTYSSSSRPRASTGGGSSSARRSAARPRTSTSRRKTGGTGRGPGRWPKGTKKSDYGNADSGPGLPPAWVAARRLAAQLHNTTPKEDAARAKGGSADEGKEMKDVVQVHLGDSVAVSADGTSQGSQSYKAKAGVDMDMDEVVVKSSDDKVKSASPSDHDDLYLMR